MLQSDRTIEGPLCHSILKLYYLENKRTIDDLIESLRKYSIEEVRYNTQRLIDEEMIPPTLDAMASVNVDFEMRNTIQFLYNSRIRTNDGILRYFPKENHWRVQYNINIMITDGRGRLPESMHPRK